MALRKAAAARCADSLEGATAREPTIEGRARLLARAGELRRLLEQKARARELFLLFVLAGSLAHYRVVLQVIVPFAQGR